MDVASSVRQACGRVTTAGNDEHVHQIAPRGLAVSAVREVTVIFYTSEHDGVCAVQGDALSVGDQ
jgi:hypothetical protein